MTAVSIDRGEAAGLDEGTVLARLRAGGLRPAAWGNGPGDEYGWHEHSYLKVLYCVAGSIVFHTREGDVLLESGDLMRLPPHTEHAATVGPGGCRCVEAPAGPAARAR
jgi:quercetin dioxygenase-like cupin family protein